MGYLGGSCGWTAIMKITLSDSLLGSMDPEAVARSIPKTFLVKGMFFARLLVQLGPDFAPIVFRLQAPARFGRYVPFSDYPQADYVRVSAATAQKLFPGVPLREAMRLLGREDFSVFAASTFGKVILAVVGDARGALLRTPTIYTKMAPGDWVVTGEELDEKTIRIAFEPVHGTWEYLLGQLEGIVMNYGGEPTTVVQELPNRKVQFDVRHTA
jgi:uncharacterized protein (TIGR02265 family)